MTIRVRVSVMDRVNEQVSEQVSVEQVSDELSAQRSLLYQSETLTDSVPSLKLPFPPTFTHTERFG